MATLVKRLLPLITALLVIGYTLPVLAVDLPEATTRYATFITATTARLNGYVDDDGGEPCDVRFNYYAEGGAWGDNVTAWVAGWETGETAYADVTALTVDTLYYYRAEIRNSIGAVECDSVAFSAYAAPSMPNNWFTMPDVARWDATFLGDICNLNADSLDMPVETVYLFLGMIVALGSGIGALIIGKRLIPALIVLAGVMALLSLIRLLPMFFMVFSLILILGAIKMGHPREE